MGKWHRVTQREDQTQDEAIDGYGRHLTAESDHVIINRIVSLKWDAAGNMIDSEADT
jgi:hypothetical protein